MFQLSKWLYCSKLSCLFLVLDLGIYRSFNFDAWRKRFNGWVDQQKLRVNDLFRRFDSNHDGMLTREEFMKGLKASGNGLTV